MRAALPHETVHEPISTRTELLSCFVRYVRRDVFGGLENSYLCRRPERRFLFLLNLRIDNLLCDFFLTLRQMEDKFLVVKNSLKLQRTNLVSSGFAFDLLFFVVVFLLLLLLLLLFLLVFCFCFVILHFFFQSGLVFD